MRRACCRHPSRSPLHRRRPSQRTASHGDFLLDNLLFQPDFARPVVVDWQTAAWAPASIDVAYFIGGCLTTEQRRSHEADLLARYHDELCRRGVRDYSLDQLGLDYRRAGPGARFEPFADRSGPIRRPFRNCIWRESLDPLSRLGAGFVLGSGLTPPLR